MSRQTEDIKLAESNGEVVDMTPSVGTAKYCSPELLNYPFEARKGDNRHQHYDNRVDVWALGLVVLELFTFENPFVKPGERIGVPDIKTRQQPLEHAPLDWSRYPQVPLVVQEFVNICLIYNREQRPYSQALLEHPLISTPLEELRLTYIRGPPPHPSIGPNPSPPGPTQSSLLSLREESLEFNNRALEYLRHIGTVCGPEAAYDYATRYRSFIQGEITFIRKKSPQDTEDWRLKLEEILQIINSFKKPQQGQ
jgi:serine/threonine protein kinase